MNKKTDSFNEFKLKMLNWANQFNIFCLFDNNGYAFEEAAFECLLAVGCKTLFSFTGVDDFENLQKFHDKNPTWLFGHLGYNAMGECYSDLRKKESGFGDGFFFEPEIIIKLSANNVEILKSNRDNNVILEEIENTITVPFEKKSKIYIDKELNKNSYLAIVQQLKEHIKRGDCYEINFCQKFEIDDTLIEPIEIYKKLTKISPAPFGALYKLNHNYCMCASPERFLQKKGLQLISQPIKGTSRRDLNEEKDLNNKNHLTSSTKEKSENVMVVDLVRNDMNRICKKGTVKVKELFGVYSFPQVHQMISTIEGTLSEEKNFTDAIAACFPMGSMTGAPKKRVMELIDRYESEPRGLFSGSIGYIKPNADFDFNVVIRSIFYNSKRENVSFFAGSGITFYSQVDEEFEECMLKANAIIKVLTGD